MGGGSKYKRRVRKQTVGNRFEFFDFILLKETFREEMRYDLIPRNVNETKVSYPLFVFSTHYLR